VYLKGMGLKGIRTGEKILYVAKLSLRYGLRVKRSNGEIRTKQGNLNCRREGGRIANPTGGAHEGATGHGTELIRERLALLPEGGEGFRRSKRGRTVAGPRPRTTCGEKGDFMKEGVDGINECDRD